MKKITFWKSLFLLFALIVGSTNAWADPTYEWVLVEDYSTINTSDVYVIACNCEDGNWYSLKNNQVTSKAYLAIGSTLTINNKKITSTVSSDETWQIETTSTTGQYYIKSTKGSYYLQNAGETKSFIKSKHSTDNNNRWLIHETKNATISSKEYTVTGLYNVGQNRMLASFLGSNNSVDWRCYTSGNYNNISNEEVVFYKRVEITPHTLTFSATGGTITATNAATSAAVTSGASVPEGTILNIIATPNSGYTFTGWSSSPSANFGNASSASTTYVMPTTDATLIANFEADNTEYDITLNPSSGGTIDASVSSAKSGTEITLTPTPDSGYRFVSWTVLDGDANEVTVTNNKFTMPASDVEVEGTFAREYAITINAAENGSVEADPTAGIAGETITLTATPAANYALSAVTVKDADNGDVEVSGTGNTRTFTMPAKAVTVTPTFSIPKGSFLDPYTVAEVWEMYNANSSLSVEGWVTGYIVGSVPQNNQPIATSTGHSTTTLALMGSPTISNPSTNVVDRTDLLVIQMEGSNIISKNNNVSDHPEHIGKIALIKGTIKKYYGIAGVNPSTIIQIGNMMTLKGVINSTADIPGYTDDGSMVYYVKVNEEVDAKNVIHENPGATTLTVGEYVISDDDNIYIPYDITASKVTNDRTLSADADAYTWYEPYAYTLPAGNTAYTFTGASGSSLTFTELGSQTLAANTPYLIIAGDDVNGSINAETVVKATPATNTSGGTQGDWQFVGTYNSMTAAEAATANMWALGSGNKWKYYTGTDTWGVYPRRCYMINSTEKASNNARTFDTVFGGEATYIELVNKTNPEESRIYTLDGKYVGTKKDVLKSGVYVSNGKKFVIK